MRVHWSTLLFLLWSSSLLLLRWLHCYALGGHDLCRTTKVDRKKKKRQPAWWRGSREFDVEAENVYGTGWLASVCWLARSWRHREIMDDNLLTHFRCSSMSSCSWYVSDKTTRRLVRTQMRHGSLHSILESENCRQRSSTLQDRGRGSTFVEFLQLQ